MDGYTIGLVIKALLASAGLKATVVLVTIGGFFFLAFRTAKAVGTFLAQLIANRDAMLAQLAMDIKLSDERRAEHQLKLAEILAKIGVTSEIQLKEARDMRKETSDGLAEIKNDLTWIKGAKS